MNAEESSYIESLGASTGLQLFTSPQPVELRSTLVRLMAQWWHTACIQCHLLHFPCRKVNLSLCKDTVPPAALTLLHSLPHSTFYSDKWIAKHCCLDWVLLLERRIQPSLPQEMGATKIMPGFVLGFLFIPLSAYSPSLSLAASRGTSPHLLPSVWKINAPWCKVGSHLLVLSNFLFIPCINLLVLTLTNPPALHLTPQALQQALTMRAAVSQSNLLIRRACI